MDVSFEVMKWGKWKILWIDSTGIEESLSFIVDKSIDGMGISPHKGFKDKDLSFLTRYDTKNIKGIVINNAQNIDISAIKTLSRIKFVSLGENKQPVDFGNFGLLEEIRAEWHNKMIIGGECRNLRYLHLWSFKPKSKNIIDLSVLHNLEELSLIQTSIDSLSGIGELKKLRRLELAYARNLQTIDEIDKLSRSLEIFNCDNCRKIKNHDFVANMKKLRLLTYNDSSAIPSIRFIKKMRGLRDFRFVGTDVIDGDMTPCIGLEYAAFSNKRHFSHTFEEMKSLNEKAMDVKG